MHGHFHVMVSESNSPRHSIFSTWDLRKKKLSMAPIFHALRSGTVRFLRFPRLEATRALR